MGQGGRAPQPALPCSVPPAFAVAPTHIVAAMCSGATSAEDSACANATVGHDCATKASLATCMSVQLLCWPFAHAM